MYCHFFNKNTVSAKRGEKKKQITAVGEIGLMRHFEAHTPCVIMASYSGSDQGCVLLRF